MNQYGTDVDRRNVEAALASLQLPHMPRMREGSLFNNTSRVSSDRRRQRRWSSDGMQQSIRPQAGFNVLPSLDRRSQKRQQQQRHQPNPSPTVTILVCADIDLKSTSALVEYTLQQQQLFQQHKYKLEEKRPQHHFHFDYSLSSTSNRSVPNGNDKIGFDSKAIDLIIAAGPCTRDEDLISSFRGQQKHALDVARRAAGSPSENGKGRETVFGRNGSTDNVDAVVDVLRPFLRSHEKSSALEGLMTAALSQLESIVCRVVYCPGFNDPITTILPTLRHSKSGFGHPEPFTYHRLTPNSRNINQQWLPLAGGLGCAALFFIDGIETLINDCSIHEHNASVVKSTDQRSSEKSESFINHSSNSTAGSNSDFQNQDDNEDEADEVSNEVSLVRAILEQLSRIQKR